MSQRLVFMTCVAAMVASPAMGDFLGIVTTKIPSDVYMESENIWSVDVFALFDDPNDELLSVDADIQTDTAVFYQNVLGDNTSPLANWLPLFGEVAYDSFVTVGLPFHYDDFDDGTALCPNFEDVNFNTSNHFAGCWFNADPDNPQGVAGGWPGYKVRIARLSTTSLDPDACPKVWGEVTVTYLDGGLTVDTGSDAFLRSKTFQICSGNLIWQLDGNGFIPFGLAAPSYGYAGCSDCLVISNIGASGDDGVEMETGNAAEAWLTWDTEAMQGDPHYGWIELTVEYDPVEGEGEVFGSLKAERIVEEVVYARISHDYDPVGAPSSTHRFFDAAGNLIGEVAGLPSTVMPTATTLPDAFGFADLGGESAPTFRWDQPVFISIPGGPGFSASHMQIVPDGIVGPETISALSLRASQVDRVVMTSSSVTPGDPQCFGDLTGDCLINTSDLLALLAAWGPCAGCPEDLNGDGIVNVADLLLLLTLWS